MERKEFYVSSNVKKIITSISLVSYSIYLIHLDIFSFAYNKFEVKNLFETLVLTLILIFIVFILSFCMYSIIEVPFLRFREKITKNMK